MWCSGRNPDLLLVKQSPYLLYYLSTPQQKHISKISQNQSSGGNYECCREGTLSTFLQSAELKYTLRGKQATDEDQRCLMALPHCSEAFWGSFRKPWIKWKDRMGPSIPNCREISPFPTVLEGCW